MNTQDQISKLQGLLERIQVNASRPRASAPLAPPVAFAAPPPLPAAPPPFAAAPAYTAPEALDPIDDLLGATPEASPLPVEIDVPLDTLPPVADVSAAPSEFPEAEAIPLVSATAESAPPAPPLDDAFALDSEVSEVRVTTIVREPAPEVTVAAIEAEAEVLGTEELSDDDLVEVTEGTPPPAATDVDIDFEDEDEQPPASSQRSKVASTMDEALAAAAADQLDGEREVPLKTPPPESGPQAAQLQSGLAAPPAPDVDALLGQELDIPQRTEVGMAVAVPTAEQLGQTIELEEARGPSLELAEPPQSSVPPAPVEELEVALPSREVTGYDDNLQPPPEAREELEAHRRRLEDDFAPPPESLAQLPSQQPGPAPEIVPLDAPPPFQPAPYEAAPPFQPEPFQPAPYEAAPPFQPEPFQQAPFESAPLEVAPVEAAVGPEVIARPAPTGSPESFASVRESFRPSTFVDLLDASLALHGQ